VWRHLAVLSDRDLGKPPKPLDIANQVRVKPAPRLREALERLAAEAAAPR
jgi:hypothetical protein